MTEGPSEARARFRLEARSRRLGLTDGQRAKLASILEQAELGRSQLTEPCLPRLQALSERGRKQVDEVLTEEQRRKHHQMLEHRRKQRDHHWSHRHHGPPFDGRPTSPSMPANSAPPP